MRAQDRAPSGDHAGDHAGGVREPVPGDRGSPLRPRPAQLDGLVPAAGGAHAAAGTLSDGRQHASRAGRADGGDVGPAGSGEPAGGPRFEQPVPPGGYAWWYIDALSDDGRHGLTLIAFIGNVFSPYYAWARRRGPADPHHHCALNVALYGDGGNRWTLTERGRGALRRGPAWLEIGPSALSWDGNTLTVRIDEVTSPVPTRIRGTVRLRPEAVMNRAYPLDAAGRHRWSPVAPCSRVEVALDSPGLRWAGSAYFDSNAGDEPLEAGFRRWDWSRAALRRGTAVLYDVTRRDGGGPSLALRFDPSGSVEAFAPPPASVLPQTRWRIARGTRADVGHDARVIETLEDTPFYARSLLSTHVLGEPATAVHESLSLERFRAGWVQALLPFRMPRALR
jgi:carotenoid 1,2-hydratase